MDTEAEIRKRFDQVVAAAFKPPILIGPKWLRPCEGGKPAPFEFMGAPKIAKAAGRDLDRIIQMLQRRVRLSDLGFRIEVGERGTLYLQPIDKPIDKPADQPAAKPDTGSAAPAKPPPAEPAKQ